MELDLGSLSQVNLTTFVGLMALTTFLIGLGKSLRPSWVKGKETLYALLLPAGIGAIVKLAGWGFTEVAWWPGFVLGSVGVSVGSGLVHDSVSNPLKSLLKILPGLLNTIKEDTPAGKKKRG